MFAYRNLTFQKVDVVVAFGELELLLQDDFIALLHLRLKFLGIAPDAVHHVQIILPIKTLQVSDTGLPYEFMT
jgi:hypothetical protein